MPYRELSHVEEDEDPGLTFETRDRVAKLIDNTGLSLKRDENRTPHVGRYGLGRLTPIRHHLGNHDWRATHERNHGR
ncbi:MAG: hypothetical protein JXR37_31105 [Kiritimatiellae bacterium]|nr:hypothetical protein [Kiritimatiellia bacterium]